MAERRYSTPMTLGYPGALVYVPQENRAYGEPGRLEVSRFTSSLPRFNIIGPLTSLYPSSKTHLPETSSKLWRARQSQERWLLNSHPEAFMGNTVFQGIMKEEMEHSKLSEEASNDRPLLDIGHMPDLRDKSGSRSLPVMAVASGESGELLRLALMDDTQWQWGENENAFLNISAVDPAMKEAEVIWASDGLPILQIKFAGDRSQSKLLRWLLVQKQTSTTILRPKYRQIIGTTSQPGNLSLQQRPSFINPNPLLAIHHHQTGGSVHSDAVLIPTSSGRSPQVGIIDVCGYWSVWDILGARQVRVNGTARSLLYKCGHISDGLLYELPLHSSHLAEKHGMLVVGRMEADQLEASPTPSSKNKAAESASRHLLFWNREQISVLDLDSNTLLPRLGPLLTRKGKSDWILDVQCSPVCQNHVFVLASHHIVWVDVFSHRPAQNSSWRPSIILTCPHLGTEHDDSRMFVCRASGDDADRALVFIFYPRHRQLCIFWFTFSSKSRIPQWHRDTISLPGSEEFHARNFIQLMRVDPARLAISVKDDASSLGINYHQRGVKFYQLNVLGDDLSLQHCVCAISDNPGLEISCPTTRAAWAENRIQGLQKKKQKVLLRHISSSFVIPDGLTTEDLEALFQQKENRQQEPQEVQQLQNSGSGGPRPVKLKVDKLCRALRESLRLSVDQGKTGLPSKLFDALRQALNEGRDRGKLPLLTWGEAVGELPTPIEYESADNGMEEAVKQLLDENNETVVITQLRRYKPDETPTSLVGLPHLRRCLTEIWLNPVDDILSEEMQRAWRIWIAELARDAFLSNYGIMVQDTPLLGLASSEGVENSQGLPQGSQVPRPSRSSSGGAKSSPARSTPSTATDGAIQRLQLLAPSLRTNKLGVSKQAKVLAYWPSERGVDTSNYVSSIARANDELFRGARERLQKIEAKRKARSDKYRRPAFMRQGVADGYGQRGQAGRAPTRPPPVQIMSSQAAPEARQTQGPFATMSQPEPGVFGARKKAAKGKRKVGFR